MSVRFAAAVPQFAVSDVVRTARYYQDRLGFDIVGYWDGERVHHDEDARAVFGIVQRDEVRLHFNRSDVPFIRTGHDRHGYDVYFHVEGVDELAHELRERGADILDGPEDRTYGQRELIVRDCNELILAFGEDSRHRSTPADASS